MDDAQDDWMFDSIKKYKTLLMFDLHNVATSLTWVSDKSICVSTDGKDKHEILEMSIPEKVLTSADSEGLCNDRDFRVISGGFSEAAVKEIKHIPSTRSISVTEKGDNSLSIWKLGNSNSDLIEKISTIKNPNHDSMPATQDVLHDQAVFGSTVSDICITDIMTSKVTQAVEDLTVHDSLSKLFYVEDKILLACCQQSCHIWRFDLREGLKKGERIQLGQASMEKNCQHWTYDVEKPNKNGRQLGQVISLSSHGLVLKTDLRNTSSAPSIVELAGIVKSAPAPPEYLTVQISPESSDIFSVSGLDKLVHVYNFKNQENGQIIQSDFSHEGHMACSDKSETLFVTSHMWHSWQPNLILSSASDGSLHAWQRECN